MAALASVLQSFGAAMKILKEYDAIGSCMQPNKGSDFLRALLMHVVDGASLLCDAANEVGDNMGIVEMVGAIGTNFLSIMDPAAFSQDMNQNVMASVSRMVAEV